MASLTLAQAALLSQDELVQGIGLAFSVTDLFTQMLPVYRAAGKAVIRNRESTNPTTIVGTVDINGSLIHTPGVTTRETHNLGRIAGAVRVDSFEQKTQSGINDQTATQVRYKTRGIYQTYSAQVITGTNTFPQFAGLNTLVDSSNMWYAAGSTTAGGAFSFAVLDELIKLVPRPGSRDLLRQGEFNDQLAIIMPSALEPRLYAAYRALGGASIETVQVGLRDALTGQVMPVPVPGYRGIPILINDGIAAETTYSGGTKYRINCVMLGGEHGLYGLIPPSGDFLDIGQAQRVSGSLNYEIPLELITGLTIGSQKALAQAVNVNTS